MNIIMLVELCSVIKVMVMGMPREPAGLQHSVDSMYPGYYYGSVVGPPARVGFWAKMAAALGVTQLIIGVSCVIFHIIASYMDGSHNVVLHYIGQGVITGGVIIVAGAFGIASSKKKTNCTIVTFLVLSVLAGLFALFPMVLGIMGATMMTSESLMMPICQLVLATVEMIVATWSIGVSAQATCCPNSSLAATAQHMTGSHGFTQLVSNSDGQHVVIFSGTAPHPAVMYSVPAAPAPFILQQGVPNLPLTTTQACVSCAAISSPGHSISGDLQVETSICSAVRADSPGGAQPSHAAAPEESPTLPTRMGKTRTQTPTGNAHGEEKEKLLPLNGEEERGEAQGPEEQPLSPPAVIEAGFEVTDEGCHLLED